MLWRRPRWDFWRTDRAKTGWLVWSSGKNGAHPLQGTRPAAAPSVTGTASNPLWLSQNSFPTVTLGGSLRWERLWQYLVQGHRAHITSDSSSLMLPYVLFSVFSKAWRGHGSRHHEGVVLKCHVEEGTSSSDVSIGSGLMVLFYSHKWYLLNGLCNCGHQVVLRFISSSSPRRWLI